MFLPKGTETSAESDLYANNKWNLIWYEYLWGVKIFDFSSTIIDMAVFVCDDRKVQVDMGSQKMLVLVRNYLYFCDKCSLQRYGRDGIWYRLWHWNE